MKRFKFILAFTIITAFIFHSCKDEDKKPDPSGMKTNTEKISNSNWKLNSATFNPPMVITVGPNTITVKSLLEVLTDCQKDNMLMFNTDSTMTIDNGSVKCEVSEPQTAKDGNWKFINNEKQIEITNSEYFKLISTTGNKVILDNITVSETQLTGETDYVYTGSSGQVTTKISFIFKK